MIKYFKIISLATLFVLSGCLSDDVEVPDQRLEGKVGGVEWTYKSANAYLQSSDFLYSVRFLSSEETITDPCALPIPGRPHVQATFRIQEGSYFIAPQVLNNNQVVVTFQLSTSETLTATSGFMEIYFADNQLITGYLQAIENTQENTVEGVFEIDLCQ